MKKLAALLILLFAVPALAGQNPAYPVPNANANFMANLQNYMNNEKAQEDLEHQFTNFIYDNTPTGNACLGVPAPGLTMTIPGCVAYDAGWRNVETNSITFPNNSSCWVAMDANTSGTNTGLPTFTRIPNTHYLIDCNSPAAPALPYNAQYTMLVLTVGGSVVGVTDNRITGFGAVMSGIFGAGSGLQIVGRSADPTFDTMDHVTIGSNTPEPGTFTNLTSSGAVSMSGAISIAGNQTNGADQINNVNVNGVINVKTYGAKCDGFTNDSVPIQNAINAAVTANAPVLIPPSPLGCVVSELNFTNLALTGTGKVQIFGQAGQNGAQSQLVCGEAVPDTGVCLDFSGSNRVYIKHLFINAATNFPPKFAVVFARDTTDSGFSDTHVLDGVSIYTNGDYALYDYGAEKLQVEHSFFNAPNGVATIVLSSSNGAGFTSPFRTTAGGPVSMTNVHFTDSECDIGTNNTPCLLVDSGGGGAVADFTWTGGYASISGTGGSFITDSPLAGLTRTWSISGLRVEPAGAGTTGTFAKFNHFVENFTIDSSTFADSVAPTVAEVQFNGAGGVSAYAGYINLRPGDGQAFYPPEVVTCGSSVGVLFVPTDATGGGPVGSNCPNLQTRYLGYSTPTLSYTGAYNGPTLPTCQGILAPQHTRTCVSDSTACTSGTPYASGGAVFCEVWCNGAATWIESGSGC